MSASFETGNKFGHLCGDLIEVVARRAAGGIILEFEIAIRNGKIFQSHQPALVRSRDVHHQVADGTARIRIICNKLFLCDLVNGVPDAAGHIDMIFDKSANHFCRHTFISFIESERRVAISAACSSHSALSDHLSGPFFIGVRPVRFRPAWRETRA